MNTTQQASSMKIRNIEFHVIKEIWEKLLWPGRESSIEPVSWIHHEGEIDRQMSPGSPRFFGVFQGSEILGVASGFRTSPNYYRSRGLWVHPDYRRQGIATDLLQAVMAEARQEGCECLWTMPRATAWDFYRAFGFREIKRTHAYEFGPHCLAYLDLGPANSNL